jgi:hypothetical protein
MIRWYRMNEDNTTELISEGMYPADADFGIANVRVGDDTIDGQRVSTVFLCMDHSWSREEHAPILFETMIFGGPYDQEMWRYSTYDEAKAGHDRIVNCLKEGINPTV